MTRNGPSRNSRAAAKVRMRRLELSACAYQKHRAFSRLRLWPLFASLDCGLRRCATPFAWVRVPVACVAASGNSRPPAPANGGPSIAPPTPPIDVGRPCAVGVALASLAPIAVGASHRQAGDRRCLFVAPTAMFRLLFVLVILGHDRRRIVQVAALSG